jgi:hypothetical protein
VKQLQREGSCPTKENVNWQNYVFVLHVTNEHGEMSLQLFVHEHEQSAILHQERGYAAEQKAQSSYYKLMIRP